MAGLLVGIIWIICAALCFLKRDKQYEDTKKTGIFMGIFFLFFGVCGVVGEILQSEKLMVTSTVLATALLCIGVFVYSVWMVNNCRTEIFAEYLRCVKYHSRGGDRYAPVFKYRYMGQEYERQCHVNYSMRKLNKLLTVGQTYQIWINEDNPCKFVLQRKVEAGYIFIFIAGLGMLWMYVYLMMCM